MRTLTLGSPLKISRIPVILCASVAGLLATTQAHSATYTYTPGNGSTDLWSAGTEANWSATPVSAPDTRITFVGNNTTVLPNSLTNTNFNDIAGQFQLNILDLQGTGPASGSGTINISATEVSTGLNFVSNGDTLPTVNLSALAGTGGLTYNINQAVTLSGNTTFTGSGTANFNFNNGIEGSAVTVTKTGTSTLSLGQNTSLGSLNIGVNSNGGKITVGNGGILSVGLGSGNLSIGTSNTGTAAIGVLDVSAAQSFFASVATVAIGVTGNNNVTAQGTLNLSASNDITATTSFVVGGTGGARNETVTSVVTTAAGGLTTLRTPSLTIGGSKSSAQFTAGAGSTVRIEGVSGTNNGRTAMAVGSSTLGGGGGTYGGTADFSSATFVGNLSSLVIGNRSVTQANIIQSGSMTLSSSEFNHLEVNGPSDTFGGVVAIGRATGGTTTGSVTGTLTIGNLDFSSQIVSTNNGTGILLGASSPTIVGTGTLNLNGGTLGITTTGSAIAGGGGVSTVNFNGTTLRAGASSTNWITNLTTANVSGGGALFDTNGFAITINQNFTGTGKLTKFGSGQLTLTGSNSFTGGIDVQAGVLFLTAPSVFPTYANPGQLIIADGAGLGVNVGGANEFTLNQINELRSNSAIFLGTNHGLAINTANATGDLVYTSSFPTLGNFAKLGANKLTLDNNPTIVGSLDVGVDGPGGTLAADSGAPFSVGSGPSDFLNIGVARGGSDSSGILDASAATSLTINVGSIRMGTTTGNGLPESALLTPANSNITASTSFIIGDSNNANPGARTNTVTTGAGGLTTVLTPNLTIGGNKSNGAFILGSGGTLDLKGPSDDRAALNVGNYNTTQGGTGSYSGTADFSAGIFKGNLSNVVVGHLNNANGSGSETATLTLSNSPENHLDIAGFGPVMVIGRYVASTGAATGTVTIGNLDSTSAITSLDDGTAILIGTGGAIESGTKATGTLNLNGGTLTITTAGAAISGDTVNTNNVSTVNFNGTTLRAGASSTSWINGLTNANVSTGGAKFDTNGFDITIPQSLVHDNALTGPDGGLTKSGAGTLTLSGINTYTGSTTVNAGTLLVSGSLSGTTAISVNNPASKIQLGADNLINDLAGLTLNSGTLEPLGIKETLGTLSLAGVSTIDFGTGFSILNFANSSGLTWTGTLSITNWSGSLTGGGADQLFFGTQLGGLTNDQLALIEFINPEGFAPGIYDAQLLPTGEIVAVIPEPASAALLLSGAALLGVRRRRRK